MLWKGKEGVEVVQYLVYDGECYVYGVCDIGLSVETANCRAILFWLTCITPPHIIFAGVWY